MSLHTHVFFAIAIAIELASDFNLKRIYIFFSSGLCTILRSEAGGQEEAVAGGCEDDPAYRNNAHFLDDGELSNHVGYYDAAALYPSSGEFLSQLVEEGEGKGKKGGGLGF